MPPPASLAEVPVADEGRSGIEVQKTQPKTGNWWDTLVTSVQSKADETPSLDLWMGEALPPVPEKLSAHIQHWEYIDMAEL